MVQWCQKHDGLTVVQWYKTTVVIHSKGLNFVNI
jgi:hypothetical protein